MIGGGGVKNILLKTMRVFVPDFMKDKYRDVRLDNTLGIMKKK